MFEVLFILGFFAGHHRSHGSCHSTYAIWWPICDGA